MNECLNTDETLLQTTNLKAEVQLFKGNKLSLYNLFSKKVRNARGASDLTPIESTTPQAAVSSRYGQWGWTTGPTPTYKFGDQWVLSDRCAPRRAVRARRQQLHPRLPRSGVRDDVAGVRHIRRAADLHRLDRPQRPLDAGRQPVGEHPPGQQRDT